MIQTPGKNPFCLEGPIRDPECFFGRRNEVREVLGFLRLGQCVSVVGPGKIGKTSLLNHVSHPFVLGEHGLMASECLFVYIDCRDLAGINRERWFGYVGSQMEEQATQRPGMAIGHVESFADLEGACERLNQSGMKPVVIMLDAFDLLTGADQLDSGFFINLRSLNANFEVAFLAASEEPLSDLEQRYFRVTDTSPFSNIFHPVRLGFLYQGESRALLTHYFTLAGLISPNSTAQKAALGPLQPGRRAISVFFRSVLDSIRARYKYCRDRPSVNAVCSLVDLVVERAAGHPYLVQWMGWHAVDIWHKNSDKWSNACQERLLGHLDSLPDVQVPMARGE
jgi:hypothetical protein